MSTPSLFTLSPSNLTARLVIGSLLLNLLVFALAALSLYEDKRQHEERTAIATKNLAELLERDISATFDRIDLILRGAVDKLEARLASGNMDEARLNAYLARQQARLPEIDGLQTTDVLGQIRYGKGQAVGLADQVPLMRQHSDPKAGLVIGKPIRTNTENSWVIPVSRRINQPDGTFAGVVQAHLPVAHFVSRFSALDLGLHGIVTFRDADFASLARYPEAQEGGGAIGQFAMSDELRSMLAQDVHRGTYFAPSPADHIKRIFSYRKTDAYPLYVIVGLARQDYLDGWWRNVAKTATLLLLFMGFTAFFTRLLSRSWKQQIKAHEDLRESEQRWSSALEGGGFCVWDWDLQSDQVTLTPFGRQCVDDSDSEIPDWKQSCHPDDKAASRAALRAHFRGRTPSYSCELRLRSKDGHWRWILTRGMLVTRSATGKPLRMIGTYVDVTSRREREEALRLAAAVFNTMDEGVLVTDSRNQIISANPAFSAITGYTQDEAIGKNPGFLSARTHTKPFYEDLWAKLNETGNWKGELLNRKKSGAAYVQWLSIKRLLDEQGHLSHHVAVFSDISERKAEEGRMRHLALHDALTNLPNRALLSERLSHAMLKAKRDGTCLALLYFDLDKFKPVNDRFGHENGDLLLIEVARRMQACVRESDTVARLGGDEFVALLPVHDSQTALHVARKILAAVSQPLELAGHTHQVSASVGVAMYPQHGSDEKQLTQRADLAMYHAKHSSGDRVLLYQPGMQAR